MAFSSIINISKKIILELILCIYYLVKFQKNKKIILVLRNLSSKINGKILFHKTALRFKICPITIMALKN